MWLMTTIGFFAIEQNAWDIRPGTLTVRAFVREDLQRLRERYLPALGEIEEQSSASGHAFSAQAPKEAVMVALMRAASDVNYASLLEVEAAGQMGARSRLYQEVWQRLETMQERDASSVAGGGAIAGLCCAGVLMDEKERVLLRKPASSVAGSDWTVVAGRLAPGKGQEEALLAAVLETTGHRARILCTLPGGHEGQEGECVYFLLAPVGSARAYNRAVTSEVKWTPIRDATRYIEMNRDRARVRREKAVLLAAMRSYPRGAGK